MTTGGAVAHCPYCAAELRDAPTAAAVIDGVLMVTHAISDADGNLYCAGYLSAPSDSHAGYFEKAGRIYFNYAVWSYDRDRKPRWNVRAASACDGLSLVIPGVLTFVPAKLDLSHALTVSLTDGVERASVPEALGPYRQALLDRDGTYVVATFQGVARLDPADDWKQVPLFARLFGHVPEAYDDNVWIAFASDGDLVIHHSDGSGRRVHVARYDRGGHRTLVTSEQVTADAEVGATTLVPGLDGIVWLKRYNVMRAITRDSVVEVAAPNGRLLADFDLGMVARPDGSLLLFGLGVQNGGHIFKATTRGHVVESLEELP